MKARSHDNPHDFVLIEETRPERHAPGSPSMRLRDASDEHERRIIADDESIYDLQRAWNSDSARLLLCERTKALQVLNIVVYVNSLEYLSACLLLWYDVTACFFFNVGFLWVEENAEREEPCHSAVQLHEAVQCESWCSVENQEQGRYSKCSTKKSLCFIFMVLKWFLFYFQRLWSWPFPDLWHSLETWTSKSCSDISTLTSHNTWWPWHYCLVSVI